MGKIYKINMGNTDIQFLFEFGYQWVLFLAVVIIFLLLRIAILYLIKAFF